MPSPSAMEQKADTVRQLLQHWDGTRGSSSHSDIQKIFDHSNIEGLRAVLNILQETKLLLPGKDSLAQKNFDAVIKHENLADIVRALQLLKDVGLFGQGDAQQDQLNFNTIIAPQGKMSTEAIRTLQNEKLLSQVNFDTLMKHKSPERIIDIINSIKKLITQYQGSEQNSSLGQTNFEAILHCQNLNTLFTDLNRLEQAEPSNENYFNFIMRLLSVGVQIHKQDDKRLISIANEKLKVRLATPTIDSELVRLIAMAYEKGIVSHHPEHAALAKEMLTYSIKDNDDAEAYLLSVYRRTALSRKSFLAQTIESVFLAVGKSEILEQHARTQATSATENLPTDTPAQSQALTFGAASMKIPMETSMSWDQFRALVKGYQPSLFSFPHPNHTAIHSAIKNDTLARVLQDAGIDNPKNALMVIYMSLDNTTSHLSQIIQAVVDQKTLDTLNLARTLRSTSQNAGLIPLFKHNYGVLTEYYQTLLNPACVPDKSRDVDVFPGSL